MIILFVVGIVLGGAAVVFALQNVAITTVTFFSWELTGSLALIILMSLGTGVVVATFMLLPEFISNYFKYKKIKKEVAMLEEELRKQKELYVFSQETPPTRKDIKNIQDGAIAN